MIGKIAVISGTFFWVMSACAQTETSSVTVVASRTLDLPIEQINYSVQVQSAIDATLDQVLQVVQGLGITANNLTGVNSSFASSAPSATPLPDTPQLYWSFSLSAPYSQFQQTLSKLRAASAPAPDGKSNSPVSFYMVSASASQATIDKAIGGALPDMMADARMRAKRLADAAGLTVGVILSVSDGPGYSVGFAVGPSGFGYPSLGSFNSPKMTVSINVRFALLRYN